MGKRLIHLRTWLVQHFGTDQIQISPLQSDASFRRYFRIQHNDINYIAMDAPPTQEDVKPFIAVAEAFSLLGVRVPEVFAADIENGFLLLTDFGDRLYFKELQPHNADQLYQSALSTLIHIQACQTPFPPFDAAFMQKELDHFQHWFLERYLSVQLPDDILKSAFELLIQSAANQPQVCVHRDYHSRNLIYLDNENVGVLDFQDAVIGPITYDAVSLLRDCYINWPREQVEQWIENFRRMLTEAERLSSDISSQQFLRWFDLMGIQRHLKALFIFARKYIRDSSHHYIPDIPRTVQYVLDVSESYPELNAFRGALINYVAPKVFAV